MLPDPGGLERQRKALDLVALLADAPASERARLLDEHCRGDDALRRETESLLREDEQALDLCAVAGTGGALGARATARQVAEQAFAGARPDRGFPPRIGRFRVIGPLGEGGMGVVLEAEQDEPKRRVAVKVLSRLAVSPKAQRRFEREADIMAQLAHPAIARVLEAGRFETDLGPQPYLAMELVEGEPLTSFARGRRLAVRERVELMAAVAEAVEHAHAHGVVHRDLKPANILVTPAGRPKILDFGVARATDVAGDQTVPATGTGQMIGTLAYMSPEQAAGSAIVDAQSDVHALGVLLYELLVGRLPHEVDGLPLIEAARVLRDEEPPRPSALVPELRGDLEAVILCALAKDRVRRYPTAAALAEDLRRWLAGEAVHARAEGAVARARRFVRRHAALTAAVGAVILTLALGLVASGWQAARATRLAHEERHRAYVADIHAADAAFDMNDVRRARRHLALAPASFRDWEWRYLASRLDVAESEACADGEARALLATPDGRVVAVTETATGVTLATTWDAATGRVLGTQRPSGRVRAACVTDSGRTVALVTDRRSLSVVDLGDGTTLSHRDFTPLGLDRDDGDPGTIALGGALVASPMRPMLAGRGRIVVTWEPGTGAVAPRMFFEGGSPAESGPTALALSPSGRRLAASSYGGALRIGRLDVAAPDLVVDDVTNQPILSLAFSPDERFILCGGQDNSAVIVDAETGEVLRSLDGHRGPVLGTAWSPDGARAMTSSEDHVIRVWDARSGRLVEALMGHESPVAFVAPAAGDGRLVSAAADGSVKTWHLATAARPRVLAGHSSFVYPVTWSPDGSRLWSGSWDGTVRAWDAATGACEGTPFTADVPVVALAASPDGSLLAVSVAGADTKLIDAGTGRHVGTLGPHDRRAQGLAFSPDGQRLATVSWDDNLRIWDVSTQRLVARKGGLAEMFEVSVPVAYSPDGTRLAIAWGASDARLLDAVTLETLVTLAGHAAHVNAIAFSPDGRLVATGSEDGTARTWDAATGRLVAVLSGHAARLHAVAFSARGTRLATGSKDGTVRLWDPWRGDDLMVLEGHRDYVYSVAFSPDGETMATGSGDGTVRLWTTALQPRAAIPGAPAAGT